MITNVPQYIDVEDKIAGPLTAKQLGWMIGLGAILFVLWMFIPAKGIFFIIAVPIFLLFVALSFYKPFGQPLVGFVSHGFMFIFAPKVYVWKRMPQISKNVSVSKKQIRQEAGPQEKHLTAQQLSALAHVLDTEGGAHDEEALELIKQYEMKNNQQYNKDKKSFGFGKNNSIGGAYGVKKDEMENVDNQAETKEKGQRNLGEYLDL